MTYFNEKKSSTIELFETIESNGKDEIVPLPMK